MKKRKIWKILVPCVILLFFIIGLSLWQPRFDPMDDHTLQVFDELDPILRDGEMVLEKETINSLLKAYVGEGILFKNYHIQNIQAEIKDEDFIVQSLISYQDIPFSLGLKGSLTHEESFIVYDLKGISLGRLPLPKGILLWMIRQQNNDQVIVEEGNIKIHKALLPIWISSLKIGEGKIFVKLDQEDGERWLLHYLQSKIQKKMQDILDQNIDDMDPMNKNPQGENPQKNIGKIKDAILNRIQDPYRLSQEELQEVKNLYNSLTAQEQQEVLEALSPQIDTPNLSILQEILGF